MPHAGFVHLRVHSAYSLLEGAIKIDELIALCRGHAMPAVAVTDTGNMFGALEFALAAAEAGVQPVIGCQIGLAREESDKFNGAQPAPDPIVLLVQSEAGYRNLMKLVSRSYLETPPGEPPQVRFADLEELGAGLIALTGGPAGPVGRCLLDGQDPAAEEMLTRLTRLFPGRLYVELMRRGLPEEARIEGRLVDLAYSLDLPLVATNEAFFPNEAMYEAHDALICIAEGAYVSEAERRRLTPEHRFKSPQEMLELFADLPEAVANTLVIARRCAYVPEEVEPILPAFPTEAGRSEAEELRAHSQAGLERQLASQVYRPEMDETARAAAARLYRERMEYEIEVIELMGYPGYFLIVADFIQWAKQQGIPVGPGRGSGAGSVVAWALTITDLDPLRWGPPFRALPQPRARLHAGLRHRLLPGAARRGDPLRAGEVWLRPGRPDHHLRKAAGARGVARRGAGAADALPAGGPHLQAGSQQSNRARYHWRSGRGRTPPAGDACPGPHRGAHDRHRAEAGGSLPPRLDPRGRRGHRRPGAGRADPALPRSALGHAGDAVLHEIRGESGPREVRLPGLEDAFGARSGLRADRRARRRRRCHADSAR